MSTAHLGRPYTEKFEPIQGADGQSLFPNAGEPAKSVEHSMKHEFTAAEDELSLRANASAWGILSASGGGRSSERYLSYRAEQIEYVVELDDTSNIRRAPRGAVFYPWRIYYGHSYEVVFSGGADGFDLSVKARLTGGNEASIEAAAKKENLSLQAFGHGLKPKDGKAIFARSDREILDHYEAADEPVPILVEWRALPSAKVRSPKINWKSAPQCSAMRVEWVEFSAPPDANDGLLGGRLDIYLKINGEKTPLRDVHPGKTYRYDLEEPLELDVGQRLKIEAWEEDPVSSNDHMGSTSITLQATAGERAMEVGERFKIGVACVP